jgi:hypothetical protein
MRENGIIANDIDKSESTTRDRITDVLGANIFALIKTLSDELEELELEPVSTQEFMIAVGDVLRGLYLDEEEEEASARVTYNR